MKTWKCGIVGTGMIADFHAKAIISQPNTELCSCVDIDIEKAKNFSNKYNCKAYTDLRDMLSKDKLDLITVATPSGFHFEPVMTAAEFGCNALCEKPLEINLERIDKMINAHAKAGTKLGCIFQYRFVDALAPLRKAIRQDRFGKITYAGGYVPWWRNEDYYKGTWHGTLEVDGGGALMNQSIHMIDMLCELMPPVVQVQAFTGNIAHDIEAEDTAVAVLRFANEALGIIYGATSSYPGQFKRFEITGNKGTVVYLENSYTVWQFAEKLPEDDKIIKQFGSINGKGGVSDPSSINSENHGKNLKAFIDSIESGENFKLDGFEGRKAVELILAIYSSAKTGKMVDFRKGVM